MISRNLVSCAVAMLVAGGAAILASPALGAVRPEIGNALKEAQSSAAAGRCDSAKAKIREAEGVGGKTGAETQTIDQMRQYVDVKCGDANSALGAKAKFANDYNAGRYRAAIDGADLLRKFGALDGTNMLIIAQAYYKLGDYSGCERYIKQSFGTRGGQNELELLRRCAYENGDTDTEREALESLVASTGKAEYWDQLLENATKTKGLKDHQTLDIYRIKYLTGSIKTAGDYKLLAELAIENNNSGEAVNVLQKAMSSNVPGVTGNDRMLKLLNSAKAQAGVDAANLAKATASAKDGETLVKLGEAQWGIGKSQDTVKLVQAGIEKGVTDKDNAQIRLGMGYLGSGQKDSAVRAFNQARNDPKWEVIAHLWSLYTRR
jgi:tetratricopeptide (TPR) repeat protein